MFAHGSRATGAPIATLWHSRPGGAMDRSHGWSEAKPVDLRRLFDIRPGGAEETNANK